MWVQQVSCHGVNQHPLWVWHLDTEEVMMDVPLWYSDWLAEVGLDMKVKEETT